MRVLLDTHAFLWFIAGDTSLSTKARQLIEDPTVESGLSVASLWEIAIKVSIGRLHLGEPFGSLIPRQLQLNGIRLLDITVEHTATVATLPFHHRDPFDRLLIAQAMVEGIPIISREALFDSYTITRLW